MDSMVSSYKKFERKKRALYGKIHSAGTKGKKGKNMQKRLKGHETPDRLTIDPLFVWWAVHL